jgi:hypothetical protein
LYKDRAIIPGAGYLLLAVESIAMMNGVEIEEIAVCIEDIKFTKATQLNETSETSLTVIVDRGEDLGQILDFLFTKNLSLISYLFQPLTLLI